VKLPPGCYASAIIEAEEKIRELKLA